MTTENFLPYGKQDISSEDLEAVRMALQSEMITRGPEVSAFESAVAEYCGAKYAVAFSNASNALLSCYKAVDTGPDDTVITTPNTFVTSCSSAMAEGARVVFVDIDRGSGNLNLDHVHETLNDQSYFSSRGKTIITPVHFAGIAVDMKRLESFIESPKTVVIEDAAHAIGSSYPSGEKVGSCAYSQMTVFSFHPVKTITMGEGGLVTTNDEQLYHRLLRVRNSGMEREQLLEGEAAPWYYEVQELSSNYNVTSFQAALGLSQLGRLDRITEKRRLLVQAYREELKGVEEVHLFDAKFDSHSCYHLFVTQTDMKRLGMSRTAFMHAFKERGIGTQLHYIPLYHHPAVKQRVGDLTPFFPEMERYNREALSLPLFPQMEEKDVKRVVRSLKEILAEASASSTQS